MPAPGPRSRSLLTAVCVALAGAALPVACGDDQTGAPADASAGGAGGRGTGGTAGSGGAGTGGATGGTGGVSGAAGTGGTGGGSVDGGDASSLDGAGDVTAPAALAFTREFAPGDVLRALGGTGPMDVWVIPDADHVWVSQGDGMFPNRPTDTGAQLTGVWGTAADNVYVSVRSNFVLRWTGSWKHEAQGIPAGTTFVGVHGSGPTDVYAYGGRIFRSAGDGVWTLVPIQDQLGSIQSLWVAAPGDVWAVDTIKSVYHLKAGTTAIQQTGAPGVPRGIWASGPTDIYLVTTEAIVHSRGDGRWTMQQTFGGQTGPTAIWAAGPNALFVGTFDGRILRSGGDGRWVAQTIDPSSTGFRDVLAIWGTSPSNVYVATTAAVYHGR